MNVVTVSAMHMSDGIVSAPVSVLFGAVAVVAVAVAVRRAGTELDERTVPLAGLVTAFIFAVQMVNFPILPGVSGHLLGGALAAILVGPYTGILCLTIVLIVQALLFADGGISALGMNVINMAVIGVATGYLAAVFSARLCRRNADLSVRALGFVGFIAGLTGTICAAMGFVLEYAVGGASGVALDSVAAYMLATHLLVGIGEGVITALTVIAVGKARPDLIYLLRRQPRRVPA